MNRVSQAVLQALFLSVIFIQIVFAQPISLTAIEGKYKALSTGEGHTTMSVECSESCKYVTNRISSRTQATTSLFGELAIDSKLTEAVNAAIISAELIPEDSRAITLKEQLSGIRRFDSCFDASPQKMVRKWSAQSVGTTTEYSRTVIWNLCGNQKDKFNRLFFFGKPLPSSTRESNCFSDFCIATIYERLEK